MMVLCQYLSQGVEVFQNYWHNTLWTFYCNLNYSKLILNLWTKIQTSVMILFCHIYASLNVMQDLKLNKGVIRSLNVAVEYNVCIFVVVLGMLKSLHQLQVENRRLEEQIKNLTAKKERLQLLNAQLSVPFPTITSNPSPSHQVHAFPVQARK